MRKILYLLILLSAIVATIGCSNTEEQQRLSREERQAQRRADSAALKIGVMPTEDCLPIVVAKGLKLFDTLGVDVRLRKYHALMECRKALTDSIVEGATIDTTLMALINSRSEVLYSGMKTDLHWQFLTARKSRISRLDQMTDKMIAADGRGESFRLAESAIDSLRKRKVPIFIIQCEDVRVRYGMLINGNVDAALLPEPYATKARKQGAKVIGKVVSGPAGVVAFRKNGMKGAERQKQYELFMKAVAIANDSIRLYGKDKYLKLLEW